MPGDIMSRHKVDEIPLRIPRQSRFGEMGVVAQEIVRSCIEIGEIAAPAARNTDFFARRLGMIDHQSVASGKTRAHHARRACAQYQRVHLHHGRLSRELPRMSSLNAGLKGALPLEYTQVPGTHLGKVRNGPFFEANPTPLKTGHRQVGQGTP